MHCSTIPHDDYTTAFTESAKRAPGAVGTRHDGLDHHDHAGLGSVIDIPFSFVVSSCRCLLLVSVEFSWERNARCSSHLLYLHHSIILCDSPWRGCRGTIRKVHIFRSLGCFGDRDRTAMEGSAVSNERHEFLHTFATAFFRDRVFWW